MDQIKAKENKLTLRLCTPYKLLVEAFVDDIYFTTFSGAMEVLVGHAPMFAMLPPSVVHYTSGQVSSFLAIDGGVVDVTPNLVTMMVDVAEEAASIDTENAKKNLQRAEATLSLKDSSPAELLLAQQARAKALARLQSVESYEKSKSSNSGKV